MHPKKIEISNFNYELPEHCVAKYPLQKKDHARLLVFNNNKINDAHYYNLENILEPNSCLFFNQTKVINARLLFQKASGGKIEIFCLEPDTRYNDIQIALSQKQSVYWKCLVGGASKWKDNSTIQLANNQNSIHLKATISEKIPGAFIIHFTWPSTDLTFAEVLATLGELPIPPYLNRKTETSDLINYQTIFANIEGSVAAPTAALHFTDDLINKIHNKDITTNYITLHVGAGTFMPVKSSTMNDHEMHPEFMEINLDTLQKILKHKEQHPDKPIIAVGTTAVRNLESLYWIGLQLYYHKEINFNEIAVTQWFPYDNNLTTISTKEALTAIIQYLIQHDIDSLLTKTQIIIAPGYKFKIIDQIITNFHQPQSTLLLLIAAYIGEQWKDIYQHALQNNYRFLSYGDGCLLINDKKDLT